MQHEPQQFLSSNLVSPNAFKLTTQPLNLSLVANNQGKTMSEFNNQSAGSNNLLLRVLETALLILGLLNEAFTNLASSKVFSFAKIVSRKLLQNNIIIQRNMSVCTVFKGSLPKRGGGRRCFWRNFRFSRIHREIFCISHIIGM